MYDKICLQNSKNKGYPMIFNAKKLYSRSALILAAAYFATFLLYYNSTYLYDSTVLTYAFIFIQRLSYLLLPAIGSVITFTTAPFIGKRAALIRLIPLVLLRFIFFVPYFYLIFVIAHFGSAFGLLYALIVSTLEAALAYLISYLAFLLLCHIMKKRSKKRCCKYG